MSNQIVNPQLQIFQEPLEDLSFQSYEYIPYETNDTLGNKVDYISVNQKETKHEGL